MMEKLDFSSYPSIVSLHASLTMARIVRDSDLIFSYCEVCSDWSNGKDKIEQTVLTQTTPAHPVFLVQMMSETEDKPEIFTNNDDADTAGPCWRRVKKMLELCGCNAGS